MIRLLKATTVLLCAASLTASASTSKVTAALKDARGHTWSRAKWSATLTMSNPWGAPP
jgi:hypothetical protein